MNLNGKSVSVYIQTDILARLDLVAEILKTTRSSLINEFLDKQIAIYEELISASEEEE